MTPTTILPGDSLTIVCPHSRHRLTLTQGEYRLVVVRSLAAKLGRKFLVRLYGRRNAITVFIPDRLSDSTPMFQGHGWIFLGRDKYPVVYYHEPNLTTRLEATLAKKKTKPPR